MKRYKMFNCGYIRKEDIKEHNPNCPKTLTICIEYLEVLDPEKKNVLLNLINDESTNTKYLNNSKAFIEYSVYIHDIYKNNKE